MSGVDKTSCAICSPADKTEKESVAVSTIEKPIEKKIKKEKIEKAKKMTCASMIKLDINFCCDCHTIKIGKHAKRCPLCFEIWKKENHNDK